MSWTQSRVGHAFSKEQPKPLSQRMRENGNPDIIDLGVWYEKVEKLEADRNRLRNAIIRYFEEGMSIEAQFGLEEAVDASDE